MGRRSYLSVANNIILSLEQLCRLIFSNDRLYFSLHGRPTGAVRPAVNQSTGHLYRQLTFKAISTPPAGMLFLIMRPRFRLDPSELEDQSILITARGQPEHGIFTLIAPPAIIYLSCGVQYRPLSGSHG